MAYPHSKQYLYADPTPDTYSTAGIKMRTTPGIHPFEVTGLSIVVTTAFTGTGVVTVEDVAPGGAAGSGTIIGTLNVGAASIGQVVYHDAMKHVVKPGREIIVNSDGGLTAGAGIARIYGSPAWNRPGNNSDMVSAIPSS